MHAERRGRDAIERLQGSLARAAVPVHRGRDGEIDGLVQRRELAGKERRRALRERERHDAFAQDGVLRHHLGEVVSDIETLDGVDHGKLLRRGRPGILAGFAHVFGELAQEIGDVIEERRPAEVSRRTQVGDVAFPAGEDLAVPRAQKISKAPRRGRCDCLAHALAYVLAWLVYTTDSRYVRQRVVANVCLAALRPGQQPTYSASRRESSNPSARQFSARTIASMSW